jgi:hypothetical protein
MACNNNIFLVVGVSDTGYYFKAVRQNNKIFRQRSSGFIWKPYKQKLEPRKGSDMGSLRMSMIVVILCAGFWLLGLMWYRQYRQKQSGSQQAITAKETLAKYHDEPVGKSIGPVARCLAGISVMVAIEDSSSPIEGKLRLRVDYDNQGRLWAYVYTDEKEFLEAFPEGTKFVEMAFTDFFAMVESDSRFAGIYFNSSPEFTYVIPRELFPEVRKIVDDKLGK